MEFGQYYFWTAIFGLSTCIWSNSAISELCWKDGQCIGKLIKASIESDRDKCLEECEKQTKCKWISYNSADFSCHLNEACYKTFARPNSKFASANCKELARFPSNGIVTARVGEEIRLRVRNLEGAVLCAVIIPNGNNGQSTIGFDPTAMDDTQASWNGRPDGDWTAGWHGSSINDCGIRVPKIVPADSGNWSITLGPSGSQQVEIDFLVQIEVAPAEVKFVPDVDIVEFEIPADGDTAEPFNFTCLARDVRPVPTVTFYLDDVEFTDLSKITREFIPYDGNSPNENAPDFPDMFSVLDTLTYSPKVLDDDKILKCAYSHQAFTDDQLENKENEDSLEIRISWFGFQSGVLTVYGNCNNIDCDPQVEVLPLKSSPSCQINGIDGLERNGGFGGTIGDDHKPVYCCGYYPDMKSALADCYIFQDGAWDKLMQWPEPNMFAGYSQLPDGKGFITSGGASGDLVPDNYYSSAYIYDGTLTKLKDLDEYLWSHCKVTFDEDRFLAIGGRSQSEQYEFKSHFYQRDLDKWSEGPGLNKRRFRPSCAVLTEHDGSQFVVVVGGYSDPVTLEQSTEIFPVMAGGFDFGPDIEFGIVEAQLVAVPSPFTSSFDHSALAAKQANQARKPEMCDKPDNYSGQPDKLVVKSANAGVLLIGGMDRHSITLDVVYKLESVYKQWEVLDGSSMKFGRHLHASFVVPYSSLECNT